MTQPPSGTGPHDQPAPGWPPSQTPPPTAAYPPPSYPAGGAFPPYPAFPAGAGGAAPAPGVPPTAPAARPGIVTGAVVVQMVLGALGVIFGLLLLIGGAALMAGSISSADFADLTGEYVSNADIRSVGLGLLVIGIVTAVVSVAAIVVAVFVGKGHGWARITSTVLLVLIGLAGLLSAPLGLVGLVAAVAAIVLMWLPDARPFFRPAPAPY